MSARTVLALAAASDAWHAAFASLDRCEPAAAAELANAAAATAFQMVLDTTQEPDSAELWAELDKEMS